MIEGGWVILGFLIALSVVVWLVAFMGYRNERRKRNV